MKITAADVGRKVKLRNGEIRVLLCLTSDPDYPFSSDLTDIASCWTSEGIYWEGVIGHKWDIIAFIDEEEKTVEEWKSLDELMEDYVPGSILDGQRFFISRERCTSHIAFAPIFRDSTGRWVGRNADDEVHWSKGDQKIWKPYTPEKKTRKVTKWLWAYPSHDCKEYQCTSFFYESAEQAHEEEAGHLSSEKDLIKIEGSAIQVEVDDEL